MIPVAQAVLFMLAYHTCTRLPIYRILTPVKLVLLTIHVLQCNYIDCVTVDLLTMLSAKSTLFLCRIEFMFIVKR